MLIGIHSYPPLRRSSSDCQWSRIHPASTFSASNMISTLSPGRKVRLFSRYSMSCWTRHPNDQSPRTVTVCEPSCSSFTTHRVAPVSGFFVVPMVSASQFAAATLMRWRRSCTRTTTRVVAAIKRLRADVQSTFASARPMSSIFRLYKEATA